MLQKSQVQNRHDIAKCSSGVKTQLYEVGSLSVIPQKHDVSKGHDLVFIFL